MIKTLKFRPFFIEFILTRDKFVTARLFDDKNLSVGDAVDLLNSETGEKFGNGKIVNIRELSFEEMVKGAVDIEGMYAQYKDYYRRDITPTDTVKYIYFEMIR